MTLLFFALFLLSHASAPAADIQGASTMSLPLSSGWKIQDSAKISHSGAELSKAGFAGGTWLNATVPGTVLTSLVNAGVYPEPLFGENNRPDKTPDSLCRTSWWYRNEFNVPADYAGKNIFLNFMGINYAAEVWVNGEKTGDIRGAFARGIFDISKLVAAGKPVAVAVLVAPQPNPGVPHEHTIALGMGQNGGITAMDGPTFMCSLGWDWIPAIRDRNTGLWQKVFLSASGPVAINDPLVTTDLPLPKLDSADIAIQITAKNLSSQPQKGLLKASFGNVSVEQAVELAANASSLLVFDPKKFPQLHLNQPKLWWPNGYGPQHLHHLKLSFEINGSVSDSQELNFGIRKIGYLVPGTENLTISVNGVPVFCRGGNWGMDEAMKRIPKERLDAQVRMHAEANFTMIRNWVGQSTAEDLYEACDKYGILLWDEFFQPNPHDGPDPVDLVTYTANVREKILRFRNHPSVAVWCGRNEGHPPSNINELLSAQIKELEPVRHYQSSSTDGKGVHSDGPYYWREPKAYFENKTPFATEIGCMSVPTLESTQGMLEKKDWEVINDDWAQHDMAKGAQRGDQYPEAINARYGQVANLADFVRKSQLASYESHRAMFEGRNAKLFNESSGVLMWMSNPAQPSFVWQIYHHDLEPTAAMYASKKACEMVHIQYNEKEKTLEVINHLATELPRLHASISIYNLDGSAPLKQGYAVTAKPSAATKISLVEWPAGLSEVHFIKLELHDEAGKLHSDNFYWLTSEGGNLQSLSDMPSVTLETKVSRQDKEGKCFLKVELHNPSKHIALMSHLQLHRKKSGERVLPVYYSDNYLSLIPGESCSVTIEAAISDLQGDTPLIEVDGWNIAVKESSAADVALALNKNAQVSSWAVTGLPRAEVRP
jgi:beta-mannosidase